MRIDPEASGSPLSSRLLLAGALVTALVATSGLALAADLPPGGTFIDDDHSFHEPYIEALAAGGMVQGCSPERFCPDRPATRAEMVTVWLRGLGRDDPGLAYQGYFPDVPPDAWYAAPVEQAFELGLIERYDSGFRPAEPVSREAMAAFLGRALGVGDGSPLVGYFSDVALDAWYTPFVERIYELGITTGCRADPLSFCPSQLLTRGEMATMVTRALGFDPIYPPGVTTTTADPCPPG